ncbi:MAG: sensor domain-containing phosphodiesterase [Pseudomonadales bacterium]|nr:sensor domain-containing phosphodiesterase [Pseudomonadales bacterium]
MYSMMLSRTDPQQRINHLAMMPCAVKEDLQAMSLESVQLVAQTLPSCERVSLWWLHENNSGFNNTVLYKAADGLINADAFLAKDAFSHFFSTLIQHRFIDADKACEDDRTCELLDLYLQPAAIKSLLSVAIMLDGVLLGFINCEYAASTLWNTEQRQFLMRVADQISLVYSQIKYQTLLTAQKVVIAEVSEQNNTQEKLKQLAYQCGLTALANRSALMEYCNSQIAMADGQLSLLSVDVNNFKSINHTLGEAAGDAVLVAIAQRLKHFFVANENVYIARVGGNEFVVAVSQNSNKMKLRLQAESLRHQLEQPVLLEDMALSIAVTIGICAYREDGLLTGDLLAALSLAMEQARCEFVPIKVAGQANGNNADVRRLLITQLETAIQNDQLSLYYQPKLKLDGETCIGFEALIRWNHPEKGLVPPAQFIPMVEKTRLITPLTHWVIKQACAQLQQWLKINPDIIIAINLSTRNLLDQNLPSFIKKQLELHDIDAKHLQLEVTESSMMADPERSIETMEQLHKLGTPLAIDDYGTGHSSLAYLRTLPVQVLKIDRTFIAEVLKFEHDRIIVESIINLAHSLGLQVVAEGVEDWETQDYLAGIGCDETQGYYFSRPLPANLAKYFLSR